MKFYVYKYIDPRTNMPFYIGKGSGSRMYSHLNETKETTINYRKFEKIQEILEDGFEPIIEIVKDGLGNNEAYEIETELIKQYGRIDFDDNGILTNIQIDAKPPYHGNTTFDERYGKEKSKKIRNKISKSNKGKTRSEKTKEKMSIIQKELAVNIKGKTYEEIYGIQRANIIKEKISNANSGKMKSQDHKQKISDFFKGKSREEIIGKEAADKHKERCRVQFLSNNPNSKNKGKTYDEMYGERAEDIKKQRTAHLKGKKRDPEIMRKAWETRRKNAKK